MLELDAKGEPRYVAFNRVGCEIGQFRPEQVIGKTAREAFEGNYGERLYELHVKAFLSDSPITEEFPLILNGRTRRIRTILNPVFDANGAVVRVVGCPLDVTTEHAVRLVEARSSAINKEMEEFISLAAHDLRSPMRRVNDIATFLREDLPDLSDANSKLLGMLENVARKSLEMISDLISHAQASEVADDQGVIESFRLKSICEQVLQTLDPEQRHHWQVSDALILGERVATQIIIRNLIDNAIKHNPTKLQVKVSASQVDAQHVEIVVCDNGKGFTDAGKAHLVGGKISAGSGFGLTGVRRLISSRGGSISIDEMQPGQGATIRVTLPGALTNSLAESSSPASTLSL